MERKLNKIDWVCYPKKMKENFINSNIFETNNTEKNIKIAILNGQPFHYEMFGYIMDYCLKRNIKLDIYTETKNNFGWLDFYINKFKKLNFEYKEFLSYPIKNDYKFIILTTNWDDNFPDILINEKFISIDHVWNDIRMVVPFNISTRKFQYRNKHDWILPIYRIINVEEKKKISKKQVVVIGIGYPKNIDNLSKLFGKDFNDIVFNFVGRKVDYNLFIDYNNIICYNEFGAPELIKLLNYSDYVLLTKEFDKHIWELMSGSIPLAFNSLCQLIMPKEMNDHYRFKSVITYDDNTVLDLKRPNYDLINQELEELDKHKMEIFDKYIINQNKCKFAVYMVLYMPSEKRVENFKKNKLYIENIQAFKAIDTINNFDEYEKKSNEENLSTTNYINSIKNKNNGKLGCNLSHIYLWKKFIETSDCDWLLVLEDDVEINNYNCNFFNNLIEVADNNHSNFIQLYTSSNFIKEQTNQKKITEVKNGNYNYSLYQMIPQYGTVGYMINKKGISFMLSKLPYDNNIDLIISMYCSELNALCLINNIVINKGAIDLNDKNSEFGSLLWNNKGKNEEFYNIDYNDSFDTHMIVFMKSDKRVENYKKVKEQVENVKLFEAIDSINNFQHYIEIDKQEKLSTPKFLDYCKKLNGKLGCNLSHIFLWKNFLQTSDRDWLLVFEDDIELNYYDKNFFNNLTKEADKINSNFIQLYTHNYFMKEQTSQEKIIDLKNGEFNYALFKMIPQWHTLAYMINKKGIQILLSKLPYDEPIDVIISVYCAELNSSCLINNMIKNKGATDINDTDSDFGSLLWNYEGKK